MSSWFEPFFLQSLLICLIGLSISSWWLYSKIKSKLKEVEDRQINARKD